MRILLHLPWTVSPGFVGGTERFALDMAKGLNRRGHQAFIVCTSLSTLTRLEGVDVFGRVPANLKPALERHGSASEAFYRESFFPHGPTAEGLRQLALLVYQQVSEFESDVVHLNGFVYSSALDGVLPGLSKTIITNHECLEEMDNCWGEGMGDLLIASSDLLRSSARLFTPSRYYAETFSRLLVGNRVRSIPLGVDLPRCPVARQRARRPDDSLVVLVPSRLEPRQKGQDIALEALRLLADRGLPCRAVFSGADTTAYSENVQWFWSEASRLCIGDLVELRRFEDMAEAWESADVVVSPERYCSYGLSISEALASGKHVVLSPIPTYLEIASGWPHAHVTKENTPECLAAMVESVRVDNHEPSTEDVERFRSANSFEHCLDEYEREYRGLLGQ